MRREKEEKKEKENVHEKYLNITFCENFKKIDYLFFFCVDLKFVIGMGIQLSKKS